MQSIATTLSDLPRKFYCVAEKQLLHPQTMIWASCTSNSEERKIVSQCVKRYSRKREDLRTLSEYVTPIFDRVMTPAERSKWALHAAQLRRLADQYGLSSPKSTTAINRIAKGEMLSKSETNAMEHLAHRLRAQGIEILDLIRKE